MSQNIFGKRHYVWLTSILRGIHSEWDQNDRFAIDCVVMDVAQALEDESPHRFNKTMFLHNIFCDPTNEHDLTNCPFHDCSHSEPNTDQ